MSYNPFETEYQNKRVKITAIHSAKKELFKDCEDIKERKTKLESQILSEDAWHSSITLELLQQECLQADSNEKSTCTKLNICEKIRGDLYSESKRVKDKIGSLFNPLNWLSAERSMLVKYLEKITEERAETETRQKQLKLEYIKVKQVSGQTKTAIERFRNYECFVGSHTKQRYSLQCEFAEKKLRIDNAEQKLASIQLELDYIQNRQQQVDEVISPLISELEKCYHDIDTTQCTIKSAGRFAKLLNQAQTPGERRQIHLQCEQHLGSGKPQQVVEGALRAIKGLDRSLTKLNDRIERLAFVTALDIKGVIVDGSNLMNERKKFIGLAALLPLTNTLRKRYSVSVVFDPGALGMLQISLEELHNQFDPSVTVYVSASEADETILNLAQDKSIVVLSRDGFIEFPDKKAVSERRIFKPEIIDKKIYISELNLEIIY